MPKDSLDRTSHLEHLNEQRSHIKSLIEDLSSNPQLLGRHGVVAGEFVLPNLVRWFVFTLVNSTTRVEVPVPLWFVMPKVGLSFSRRIILIPVAAFAGAVFVILRIRGRFLPTRPTALALDDTLLPFHM